SPLLRISQSSFLAGLMYKASSTTLYSRLASDEFELEGTNDLSCVNLPDYATYDKLPIKRRSLLLFLSLLLWLVTIGAAVYVPRALEHGAAILPSPLHS